LAVKTDTGEMTNPGLKVAAGTRILGTANLTQDLLAFGHFHRGRPADCDAQCRDQ
jgi:hypothetical protein